MRSKPIFIIAPDSNQCLMCRQLALRFAPSYVVIADIQALTRPGSGEQRMWKKIPWYLILYVVLTWR